jgi:tetratricopeptide (TPR) repeat protein
MKKGALVAGLLLSAGLMGLAAGPVLAQETEMPGKHPHFARPDAQGDHPYYLHALSDLRHARAHLDKMVPSEVIDAQSMRAINEIDAAIKEIKLASFDDGKNLNDHPPIDAKLTRNDRYIQALELLRKAKTDINRKEDDSTILGLQHRAMEHISAADKIIEGIVHETHQAAEHPAYLHALSDLRFARAHLEKFSQSEAVNEQELHAIAEIDDAIKEIKAASIDDGKNLKDHPVIDAALKKTDRYHKALELLEKASQDIRRKEEDKAAQELQRRALFHIGGAEKAVHEALDLMAR